MPSKKILVTLIICIAILSSVSIFEWRTNIKILNPNKENIVVDNSATNNGANANQKNWQGLLSEMTGTTTILSDSNGVPIDPNNLTAQMAQSYFGQFLMLSQNGGQVTESDANQIAQNTVSASDLSIQAKVYTTKDINIKPTNTQNILNYFSGIDKSFTNNSIIFKESELDILNQAVVSGKQSDIDKLDPIIAGYKKILNGLLKIPVPSEATGLHLELLNSISVVTVDIESMKSTITDPVKGLVSIKQFQEHYSVFSLAFKKMGAYFKLRNLMK